MNRIKTFRDMNIRAEVTTKLKEFADVCSTKNPNSTIAEDFFDVSEPKGEFEGNHMVCMLVRFEILAYIDSSAAESYDGIRNEDKAKSFVNPRMKVIQQAAESFKNSGEFGEWEPDEKTWKSFLFSKREIRKSIRSIANSNEGRQPTMMRTRNGINSFESDTEQVSKIQKDPYLILIYFIL